MLNCPMKVLNQVSLNFFFLHHHCPARLGKTLFLQQMFQIVVAQVGISGLLSVCISFAFRSLQESSAGLDCV